MDDATLTLPQLTQLSPPSAPSAMGRPATPFAGKRKLALLIPAHNEDMVIADTIRSAIRAGQPVQDIYVVSDGSKDWTVPLATLMLDDGHVLDQPQSGKAGAIRNGISHFGIKDHYIWVHIADADGVFRNGYFTEMTNRLDPAKYVAGTGHLQSLKGGMISKFRTYEYSLGLEITRRVQTFFGTIPVIPGATCVLRTDIIDQLDFNTGTLTEDMDLTLQIHRQNLGKIAFIPQAKTLTQDPKDFHDFYQQLLRWDRGIWQTMQRHRIGRRFKKIDFYLSFMILEDIILVLELITIPFWAWWSTNYGMLSVVFLYDLFIFAAFNLWAAWLNQRYDILKAFPAFYFLRYVNVYVLFKTWHEIVVQKKFSTAAPGWSTAGRRYRIASDASPK